MMNQTLTTERHLKVILSPVVSEKSTRLADEYRQFVFKVLKQANKPEIKAAVEYLFNVKVDKVRICNTPGKKKRFGQIEGQRKGYKKAIVSLKEGYDIDFTSAEVKE